MSQIQKARVAVVLALATIAAGGIAPVRASQDVVFTNRSFVVPQASRVCLGDGTGGFACSDVDADIYDSEGVALGLIDGDPYLDVIFANTFPPVGTGQVNRVCFGDGYGAFIDCTDVSPDTNASALVALGLIDGDTNLDAVFSNLGQRNRVCLGDGMGGFSCSDVSNNENDTGGVALGLVDGDAALDAVFSNADQINRVCLGDGLGGFTCSAVSADTNNSYLVALGLIDGDANLDAVFSNFGQRNRICLGDGMGGFSCSDVSTDANDSVGVSLGLVNGDAHLDAVFGNWFQRNRVCLGDGLGNFACGDVSTDTNGSSGNALGFFNDDQNLDVVFANGAGPGTGQVNRVCFGDGLGGFTCSDVSGDEHVTALVAVGDLDIVIFTDDFESGDTSAWSRSVP